MANYNKVILVGNLTRDPQLSYLPNQTPVCEFSLAVNRRWRGTDGEQREETCFIDCRCYGKQAETFNQYMSKGRPVLIEGRLQLDRWESQDGQKRSKHRISVQNFQFLGQGGRDQSSSPSAPRQQSRPVAPPQDAAPEAPAGPEYDAAPMDQPVGPGDDIPF